MSWRASAYVKGLVTCPSGHRITRNEKLVGLVLADSHQDKGRSYTFPSVDAIAEDSLMSKRECQRVLASLEAKGVIERIRPEVQYRGLTSFYRFPSLDQEGCQPDTLNLQEGRQKGGQKGDRRVTDSTSPLQPPIGEQEQEQEQTHVQDKPAPPPEETLFQTQEETPPLPSRGPADVIREHLFPYYLSEAGRGDYGLTPLRLKKGVERLRECLKRTGDPRKAVELFEQAIDGLTGDPWNCGVNPQKKKYLDWIDHLCVSPEMFDKRLEAGVAA